MSRILRLVPFAAAIVVLIDGWLKYMALVRFPTDASVSEPGFFTLAVHRNYGIAFNIPLKLPVILVISLILGIVLLDVARRNRHSNPPVGMAALLILIGGLGNVYDRVVYGFTVDYLLFFGRSALNLSDLVILSGILWLLFASRKQKEDGALTKASF